MTIGRVLVDSAERFEPSSATVSYCAYRGIEARFLFGVAISRIKDARRVTKYRQQGWENIRAHCIGDAMDLRKIAKELRIMGLCSKPANYQARYDRVIDPPTKSTPQ